VQFLSGFNLLVVIVYICHVFTHGDEYLDAVIEILVFIEDCIECCTCDILIG